MPSKLSNVITVSIAMATTPAQVLTTKTLKHSSPSLLPTPKSTMDSKKKTPSGGSRYKFATGLENVTASLQVYGLMQCNQDLSNTDCSDCLQVGITQLESCCNTISGAGVYGPSCGVQFENNQFANTVSRSPPPSSSSSPLANPTSKQGKITIGIPTEKKNRIPPFIKSFALNY
ncbi:Cysteine-rich receptor-like protein kinase 14 [Bienertia sinuspersici]